MHVTRERKKKNQTTMMSRAATSTLRSAAASLRSSRTSQCLVQSISRRNMGGGSHWMEVSKRHTWWGEAFGFVCWMWIFHRARLDGPVVLGWRHPWEHAPGDDDHALPHVHDEDQLQAEWDTFLAKAIKPGEDDDDDDEEEDDDDDDDDE